MFSFLAFKALVHGDNNELKSPVYSAAWIQVDIPTLGRTYYQESKKDDVKSGYGIYAGLYETAVNYGKNVYLVAPDPAFEVVEGCYGWRSGAAFVVAGPFSDDNVSQAAKIIVSAHRSGYPQIKAILMWAASICNDGEIIAENADEEDIDFIYRAGCSPLDKSVRQIIIEKFLAYGNARYFFEAGNNWCDSNWDGRIADALIEASVASFLFFACQSWPDDRFTPNMVGALAKTKDGTILEMAGEFLQDSRWCPDIALALLESGDLLQISIAGAKWQDSRWLPEFTDILLESGESASLFYACINFPDQRWTPAIIEKLLEVGNADQIYGIGAFSKPERWDNRVTDALIKFRNPEYLYLACINWPDSRYTPRILDALIETGDSKFIEMAGESIPKSRWSFDIIKALVSQRDPEFLCYAHTDFTKDRYSREITEALVATGDAAWINVARLECPKREDILLDILVNETAERLYSIYVYMEYVSEKVRRKIVDALIEKADIEILLNASVSLPDEKYDSRIVDVLKVRCNEFQLLHLIKVLDNRRYDPSLVEEFCNRASASWLGTAMCVLEERYDKMIGERFFEKADRFMVLELVSETARKGVKFSKRILEHLVCEKKSSLLEWVISMLPEAERGVIESLLGSSLVW